MAIAITLKEYLDQNSAHYDLVTHPHVTSSLYAAASAHVPGDQLAKPVIVSDEDHYTMVIVPASHRVELGTLSKHMKRQLGLATEQEVKQLFNDCDPGAVPPVGQAYGLETVIDPELFEQSDIYIEAGDHKELVHMTGKQYAVLMKSAEKYHCSHRS